MNKYKKLIGNSVIFAIGNLGSKLMQFVMVPLYSFALSTKEFGQTDIITTMVSLLCPIVSLEIFDAVFRFAMDKENNVKRVFSSGIAVTTLAAIFTLALGTLFEFSSFLKEYHIFLSAVLLICTIFYSLISNFARAIGYSKMFAIAGMINTFFMVVMNIILLVYLRIGVSGYVLSMIIGQATAILFLLTIKEIHLSFNISFIDVQLTKKMLVYSLPLIPNAFSWWLNSSSDRLFITLMVGAGANGIYAMANKIPNALNTLTTIFFQSWQISAVEEYDNKDAKLFISNVFNFFMYILLCCSILILAIVRPLFKVVIAPGYFSAWQITYIVLWSLIYSSLSGVLGTLYTATKKTAPILITTIYGALINLLASLVLIHFIGIFGAALANVISFLLY
ncbi:oligosaccharide flippase family protein [Limosilactobacillus ingluviei]|uniref:oligosaccharide flippase family protein n=1 Tax=Limosilactobacillus ingluviei TaxID=148604 RepID=UPI0002E07A64|nr:oligosaccharide flippase family protein [Limosilactobacillus ingluviei]